jgi:hypothetical protein
MRWCNKTQQALDEKDIAIKNLLTTALERRRRTSTKKTRSVFQQSTSAEIIHFDDEYSQKMEGSSRPKDKKRFRKKVVTLEAFGDARLIYWEALEAGQTSARLHQKPIVLVLAVLASAETNQGAANELRARRVAGTKGKPLPLHWLQFLNKCTGKSDLIRTTSSI